jgi:uncharacterized membrane protein
MKRPRGAKRFWLHAITDDAAARRAFPNAALKGIEEAIAAGEKQHRGQVRFVVEPALHLARVIKGQSARERAIEVFSELRIWDTEENCGVLVYLLLADRDVELVADRGINRLVGHAAWESICRKMETHFRNGEFARGVESGIASTNELLAQHFPRGEGTSANELPDRPLFL